MKNISLQRGPATFTRLLLVIVIAGVAWAALSDRTTAAKVRQTPKTLGCKSAKRPKAPIRIVVMGSSIAYGIGAEPVLTNSWAARYGTYLKKLNKRNKLINIAAPGYVSAQELPTGSPEQRGRKVDTKHNITAALARKPDAVILSLTGNDATSDIPADETMANLGTIVKAANKRGVEVWVTTPTPRSADADSQLLLTQVRTEVKKTFGGRSLDFWTPLAGPDGLPIASLNSGDGTHPNNAGHLLLYNKVVKAKIPKSLTCR